MALPPQRLNIAIGVKNVDLGLVPDTFGQVQPRPGRGQINFLAVVGDLGRAQHLPGNKSDHIFGQAHHIFVIGVGPITLHHGEFRIMLGTDALIAKVFADFINLVKATHNQPLEV